MQWSFRFDWLWAADMIFVIVCDWVHFKYLYIYDSYICVLYIYNFCLHLYVIVMFIYILSEFDMLILLFESCFALSEMHKLYFGWDNELYVEFKRKTINFWLRNEWNKFWAIPIWSSKSLLVCPFDVYHFVSALICSVNARVARTHIE